MSLAILVNSAKGRSYLKSEPNYQTKKWFSKNILVTEMNKPNNNNEQARIFRSINSCHQQDSNALVLQ